MQQWCKTNSWTNSTVWLSETIECRAVAIVVIEEHSSVTTLNCNDDTLCDSFGEFALWIDVDWL